MARGQNSKYGISVYGCNPVVERVVFTHFLAHTHTHTRSLMRNGCNTGDGEVRVDRSNGAGDKSANKSGVHTKYMQTQNINENMQPCNAYIVTKHFS